MATPRTAHRSFEDDRPAARGNHRPGGLLRVSDLAPEALGALLGMAAQMKADPAAWRDSRRGAAMGCVFEKPSTRTRVSLAVAAQRLGMTAVPLNPREMQLGHGETWGDTARVLSSYLDVITLRTFEHRTVQELADTATVPVVNALSNDHHPLQSLADLLALTEHFGRTRGLRIAFVGDARSNTCTSFLEACAATGMHLTVASPPGYDVIPEVLAGAKRTMEDTGGSVAFVPEPHDAVRGADAVYAEIWAPMDRADEEAERRVRFADYRVDSALLDLAGPDAVALHCLPAHRDAEITSDVMDGPRSLIWRQAANRLPTAQALLHTLLDTRP